MAAVVAGAFAASDRVLLLGGSGWLGRTAQDIIAGVPILATASRARGRYQRWEWARIRDFSPTVVVNCAFLTPGFEAQMGREAYEATNRGLTEQFVRSSGLPSVRAVVTVSSGAAVTDPQTGYGGLKAREERCATELVSDRRSVVTARAYALSGPHVRDPRAYALSDFVLQAATGEVEVRAVQPVWRRYTLATDFLQVAIGRSLVGWSGVIESGGDLVEMADLARQVVNLVNPAATVVRPQGPRGPAKVYASDDRSWRAACAEVGLRPAALPEQILATARGLLSGRID